MTARLWIHRLLRPACCLLLLLGAACGGSPEARPPRQPQAAAAPAEPAARPLTPPGAERFTTEEIARVYSEMKSCADRSGEPENLFTCACEQDLALSPTFKPADPTAHCADFARRALALIKLGDDEQARAPTLVASPEVGAMGAFAMFTVATPCVLEAASARSAERTSKCICVIHAIANGMARRESLRSNAEMAAAIQQETARVLRERPCEAPAP